MGTDFFFSGFLNYLHREKKYSLHTLEAYRNDLTQFNSFLLSEFDLHDISQVKATHIRSFIAQLMDDGISARSVNRKLSALQSYFKYAIRREELEVNPMKKIQGPKTAKRLPVYVEKEPMQVLLDELQEPDGEWPAIRDQVVLELLYGTGMRLSEALNLKHSDIHFEQNTLKVLGKRNKERIIPVHADLIGLLRQYIQQKNELGFVEDKLLVTNKGQAAYPKLVYTIVKRNLAMVSTQQKRSPHVLRHTYATHLLDNGADLNAIKELLGHSNLAATQVYTHNSIERLKEVYKQAHPKS
ncbi:MAG: integrase [Bacteroidetes bacterium]|nr:MAG: integrase [Bacteroidota bacterium]